MFLSKHITAFKSVYNFSKSRKIDISSLPRCFSTSSFLKDRVLLKDIFSGSNQVNSNEDVILRGWVRSKREQKNWTFLHFSDGTTPQLLQAIGKTSDLEKIGFGDCVELKGQIVQSPGSGQKFEMKLSNVNILGKSDTENNPIQARKRLGLDMLREMAHLRPRTNVFGATFRIRNEASNAIHEFFQQNSFVHLQTPILTSNDCEGAGDVFNVEKPLEKEKSNEKTKEQFFGKDVYLTVSGQLHAEAFACSMNRVYTFGPTFRAELTNTTKHLAEFVMIEPEMAFCDLNGIMETSEALVKHVIQRILKNCSEDLIVLDKFHKEEQEEHQNQNQPQPQQQSKTSKQPKQQTTTTTSSLHDELSKIASKPFAIVNYSEAMEILKQAKQKFEYPVGYGLDLQTEHEKYLCEVHFERPVFVVNWPKEIKPFYARVNPDEKTVACMDLLVPQIGELVGGSVREERFETLKTALSEKSLNKNGEFEWYLDLRRFGTAPHAGFGLGFERLLRLLTGMKNIKDVIPFPRYFKHCQL